ncbi:ComF family protein [Oceanobacillus sp. FSL H7-0719]|uniref:ComF family protein n=1 Tax=Oceanobacillus sp. FSL H7-0719 TaxID=2954507 RepID=UPI0032436B3A
MHCLWCMEEMQPMLSWSSFLMLTKPTGICEDCRMHLKLLDGARCKKCSRETAAELCEDCEWWQNQPGGDPLIKNQSVFQYNSFMQELITKWKYRGDYILGEIFKDYFYQGFKDYFKPLMKEAAILPIPLSRERLEERGFNQAEVLSRFLPVDPELLLARKHGEKQSKKSRYDRIMTKNPFYLQETIKKPVILVDDIYTTGATLRHAASLLKENGCQEIYSYTLIRG